MRRPHPFTATLLIAAVLAVGCGEVETGAPAEQVADVVFRNGSIYTVDVNRSWADAVAIGDGRNDIEMLQWAGRGVANTPH